MNILFDDIDFFVIDKPSGMVVNNAESAKGETVQQYIEKKFEIRNSKFEHKNSIPIKNGEYCIEDEFLQRSGIVHRIDKETSGCLLVAKNPETFGILKKQFQDRTIQKTYLCIVHGIVEPQVGTITAPIGRLPWNRMRFGVIPGGREAETKYAVKEKYIMKNVKEINSEHWYSVVEAYPKTGRTHQIRVHFKHINHPIVGDELYAGRKTSRDDRKDGSRLMLHAWKITFYHPKTNEPLTVEAPIPEDMSRMILTFTRSQPCRQAGRAGIQDDNRN